MNRFAAAALDKLFISYLYAEQRPKREEAIALLQKSFRQPRATRKFLPSSFFSTKQNGNFQLEPTHERGDIRAFQFAFPTHMPTATEENNTVRGEIFLQKEDAPCVLYLHGWRMRTHLSLQYLLGPYLKAGYHAAYLELPFHYRRAPRGTFSGEKMIQPNILATLTNVRQAVCDVRDTLGYLSKFPSVTKCALVGVSLGGWISALTCTAEEKLGACVLISPPADPVSMYYQSEVVKILKKGFDDLDSYFEKHKKLFRFCQPSFHPPILPKAHILIIEALYDRFVPKEIIEQLWEAWERPPILRYPHGHISLMLDPDVTEQILSHLSLSLAATA